MKNGAKILCIIGGVFNVLVAVGLVIGAFLIFKIGSDAENLKMFYDEARGELTEDEAALILMVIKLIGLGVLLLAVFELIGCITCFLGAFDLDSKPLMALVIMMCLFACNPFGILAGILGLIGEPAPVHHAAPVKEEKKEEAPKEEPKAEEPAEEPQEEKEEKVE